MVRGSHDNRLFEYAADAGLEGAAVLDIGAHIGYHSLVFAAMVGAHGRVVAFEPNPSNRERFALVLSRNPDLARVVQVMSTAVGESDGTTQFIYKNDIEAGLSSAGHLAQADTPLTADAYRRLNFRQCAVVVRSLDSLLRQREIPIPTIIKVDVEGAEALVLRGAASVISQCRPLFLIEIHSPRNMLECAEMLSIYDYRIELLWEYTDRRCLVAAAPPATCGDTLQH